MSDCSGVTLCESYLTFVFLIHTLKIRQTALTRQWLIRATEQSLLSHSQMGRVGTCRSPWKQDVAGDSLTKWTDCQLLYKIGNVAYSLVDRLNIPRISFPQCSNHPITALHNCLNACKYTQLGHTMVALSFTAMLNLTGHYHIGWVVDECLLLVCRHAGLLNFSLSFCFSKHQLGQKGAVWCRCLLHR